jgi:PAS domain S-box-containing protein
MSERRMVRRDRLDDIAALRLLQRVASVANESESFAQAIQAALDEVCSYTGWPVGHAYLPDPCHADELTSTSLWHTDDPARFAAFREVTESIPLRAGVGLPGRILESRRPEWIYDVTVDDNFPRAHTGRDIKVKGAFATPVLAGAEIVAILEFFSDEPEPIDEDLLELMGYVGTQLGRVAERETAAAALRAHVAEQEHLIESAYDAFVAIDRHGTITDWNRAAEVMFGWPRETVTGRALADTIIPHRYREQHLRGVARYLATGEEKVLNQRLELAALRRSGEEFPIELAIWKVEREGETKFCAFIHDITERKHAEEELRAADERSRTSEQRLLAAQKMAGVGSWDWDLENNVVIWSDQLYRNFGATPGVFEPSLESYMGLVHPGDREMVTWIVTSALDDFGSFEFEHRIIRPSDGAVRIHQCTGSVVSEDGRAVRMAGTNQDVTDRRNAEQAMQDAFEREREMVERLRELDETKTGFVSSVSHELRTPLTSIIGYLQLLQMTAREVTEEHREMLDIVERNSQRLLALIEDLLTQSRIESGTFKLILAPTDVRGVVQQTIESMLPTAVDADLVLDVAIAPDLGNAMADADHLERLLLNLLSNAMKFTPHGSVTMEARREGDDIVLVVSDTGIGIPSEDVPRVFRPFFRSANADRTSPGTGLGLVIVKAIVDAHHGTIDVSSEAGRGTTFTVRLPAGTADASAA